MTGWAWFWLGWVLVGLAVELVAVARKARGDTLTEQYRAIKARLGVFDVVLAAATTVGLVWLFGHFVLEVW